MEVNTFLAESLAESADAAEDKKEVSNNDLQKNKAVYTTTPVAGSWAGAVMIWAGAVLLWAGAVMIWAGPCSNTNFPTLKMLKNAKNVKCDGPTDRWTDRHGVL